MLQNLPDNRLRVYLIWMPVLSSDDRASAENRFREFADERFIHFWDGNLLTGLLWQRVLGMREVPWDVYLLYRAGSQWEKEPARPDFWVRQLGSEVNRKRFEVKVKEMFSKIQ
ncbi:hypothetical protein HYR99_26215 [Candidatus Poribacteria bacterium]|nr:hypothetical protein [Candidatus Poribacteria bacterium]